MEENGAVLVQTENGLALKDDELLITGDFNKLSKRLKPSNLETELIVKACKGKEGRTGLTVVDATAGLGEDSFILAAAGFRVKLYERDEIIFKLLKDAYERALDDPKLSLYAGRMELFYENSIEALKNMEGRADIVYLDPMFPERKKSSRVKKKFQLIHRLEAPCDDEEELFNAAKASKPFKIVVKRPLKGEVLAGQKPSYSLNGKAIRMDVYVFAENKR